MVLPGEERRRLRCIAIVALLGFVGQPLATPLHLAFADHSWGPGSHGAHAHLHAHPHGHGHAHADHHHDPEPTRAESPGTGAGAATDADTGADTDREPASSEADAAPRPGDAIHPPHPAEDHHLECSVVARASGPSPRGVPLQIWATPPDTATTPSARPCEVRHVASARPHAPPPTLAGPLPPRALPAAAL